MNPILKMKLRRIVDVWYWKATSERDAIANHAWRILRYRKQAEQLTPFRVWLLMVLFNVAIFGSLLLTIDLSNIDWLSFGILAGMMFFCDLMIGVSWGSMKMAKDPIYDWAEEYRDLIAERRTFRQEEFDNDLPRRKF